MDELRPSIYGGETKLFYIYTPRWTTYSAGIQVLHILCHMLNKAGCDAYLVFSDTDQRGRSSVSGNLLTPILSKEMSMEHFRLGRNPIVVYSETVPGNPLKASRVVRYLMNYVGDLGGPEVFDSRELIIAYSQNIARNYQDRTGAIKLPFTLFIPAINPNQFEFKQEGREDFYLLYAGKYRAFKGKPLPALKPNVIEVVRHGRAAQSRDELIDLLSRCRAVISLENSSIISEAVLSGAPGLFFPNSFLKEAIAEHELGWDGMSWGILKEQEDLARESLAKGRHNYEMAIEKSILELNDFVELALNYLSMYRQVQSPYIPRSYWIYSLHRVRLAFEIKKNLGTRSLARVALNFLKRRIRGNF